MPVHLFLAPAGHGKTAYALDRIRAVRRVEPLSPVWVILPNRPQVTAFRRRLSGVGGAMGIQIGTFYSIYADLLARAGRPFPRLLGPVQHRLLRAIVDHLAIKGYLHHYAPLADKPGFIRVLRDLIQELKQARIEPQDLTAVAQTMAEDVPHLCDLAALYANYQDWLVEREWVDAEGQGWLATNVLEEQPDLVSDLRLLIVDGFDEFNPTQLAVLKSLADRAAETVVLLTGDVNRDRLAHRRFSRAIRAVAAALNIEPKPLSNPQPPVASPLSHLEATLFEPLVTRQQGSGAVTCIKAQNRTQEVRAALRWVKARLMRDGFAPEEIAILARDMAPYLPFLHEVAIEFGLPLHMDVGVELAANPAVIALMSLLALPTQGWPRRAVLDAWRSPYFDWKAQGIVPADATHLDAAARAGQVIGGLDQWRETLNRLQEARPERRETANDNDNDEELLLTGIPTADEAARLRVCFEAFVAHVTPPLEATVRDYVAFIEALIGDDSDLSHDSRSNEEPNESLHIVARAQESFVSQDRDVAALQAFKDVLRGLTLAEAILAENRSPQPVPYRRFYRDLWGAVKAATYRVPAPEGIASVLVAPTLRARGLSFRAVALLGLAEGEFPRAEREDPLLSDTDREGLRELGLPLEPRLQGDEATIFYEAVCLAREKLLLTRPYLADDGQEWEASPYWQEVGRLVDALHQQVRGNDPIPSRDAASVPELIAAAADDPAAASLSDGLVQAWQRAQDGANVLRARQTDPPDTSHDGDLASLAPQLTHRYGPTHIWSASRLEAYATCPLYFLFQHDLALEPRIPPQEGFDVLALGSMYHKVLEKVYRCSPSDPLSVLEEIAQEVFDAAPEQHGFRPTALWEQQRAELTRVLADTIAALTEASQSYQPLAQEQAFGLDEHPPLVVPLDDGDDGDELRLRGFIDRLDRDADGGVRVMDYKAGSTPIPPKDFEEGQRIQLPLYALAVRDAIGLGEVSGGFYWHVRSARASTFKLEEFPGGVEAAIQTAIRYAHTYVCAIRQGRFPPQPPPDGCPTHCPAVAFCWRYTPRRGTP